MQTDRVAGFRSDRRLSAGDEIVELLCLSGSQVARRAPEKLDDLIRSLVNHR
jgi:hypothetical protein